MPYAEIQEILLWYVGAGVVVITGLAIFVGFMREKGPSKA
jgi:hypothetical protein